MRCAWSGSHTEPATRPRSSDPEQRAPTGQSVHCPRLGSRMYWSGAHGRQF